MTEREFWNCLARTAGGCWTWTRACDKDGYGDGAVAGAPHRRAHRIAWHLANGTIPDGLWVLHHCDNPPCCNPAHLWVGTAADNARDAFAKGRRVGPFRGRTNPNAQGERNPRARLTLAQVQEIRHAWDDGINGCQLARTYGVGRTTVGHIVSGRTWKEAA